MVMRLLLAVALTSCLDGLVTVAPDLETVFRDSHQEVSAFSEGHTEFSQTSLV